MRTACGPAIMMCDASLRASADPGMAVLVASSRSPCSEYALCAPKVAPGPRGPLF